MQTYSWHSTPLIFLPTNISFRTFEHVVEADQFPFIITMYLLPGIHRNPNDCTINYSKCARSSNNYFPNFLSLIPNLDHKIMSTVNLSIYLVSSISQLPSLVLAIFFLYSSTNSLVHLYIMSIDACTNSKNDLY